MTYAVTLNPHLGFLQAAVTCDLRYDGLVCRNEDLPAGMTCPDFQVRFLCEPRGQDCSGVPTPSTSHPQVGPHGPTHFTGHRTPPSQVHYPGKQPQGSECSCMVFCFFPFRTQELCESQGGRPGFPVPNSKRLWFVDTVL